MQRLSYTREGRGTPLVLIHGYLGGSDMWRGQIDHFNSDFDVIAPDLPGFGKSAGLTSHDTIGALSQHVLAFLSDLDIEKFILLGHSMGGMIVQQMAVDAPERVDRLICYGTGPVGIMPGRFETIEDSRKRLNTDGVGATARRIAATWFLRGEQAEDFAVCEALGKKVSLQTALASLSAWEHWDGRPTLSHIDCETLIIWGDKDRSYDWKQPEALWNGISRSALAVVPGCAHNVHQEKPHLFNAIVEDFVARPHSIH